MTRKCPHCQASIIEGITPASPGWCANECDLSTTDTTPMIYYSSSAWVGVRDHEMRFWTNLKPHTIPVKILRGQLTQPENPLEGTVCISPAPGSKTYEVVEL